MKRSVAEKRAAFRALHAQGCFVLPNPWDVGSARLLQHLGFQALASTSSGYAWTTGTPDNQVTLDMVLEHLAMISAAVDLPINADFESGFANEPDGVAANVKLAIETGVAGLSIEDRPVGGEGLLDMALAIERVKAAREAIDRSGQDVMLIARTEGMLDDASAFEPALERIVAFARAGADCLYAPGVWKPDEIATMVRAVAPRPVNVLILKPDRPLSDIAALGVRRVSVGGGLAGVGWGAVIRAAEAIKGGSFTVLGERAPGRKMNEIFEAFPR